MGLTNGVKIKRTPLFYIPIPGYLVELANKKLSWGKDGRLPSVSSK